MFPITFDLACSVDCCGPDHSSVPSEEDVLPQGRNAVEEQEHPMVPLTKIVSCLLVGVERRHKKRETEVSLSKKLTSKGYLSSAKKSRGR